MAFQSVSQLIAQSQTQPLWQAVLHDDCQDRGCEAADSLKKMSRLWQAMVQSVRDYDPDLRSSSGLSGGQGYGGYNRYNNYGNYGGYGGNRNQK